MEREEAEDFWVHIAAEMAADPQRCPTSEQRSSFSERLSAEIKRTQQQKRELDAGGLSEIGLVGEDLIESDQPEISEESEGWEKSGIAGGLMELCDSAGAVQGEETLQEELPTKNRHKENIQKRPSSPKTSRKKTAGRKLRRVATAVVFVICLVGTSLFFTDEAFGAGVSNFFSRVLPKATELSLKEKLSQDVEFDLSDFEGMYVPGWIPEGYELSEIEVFEDLKHVIYRNSNEDMIHYYIYLSDRIISVDNEDVVENALYIHDSWGKIISKDSKLRVIWEDTNCMYSICGKSNMRDELIKMAEKCEKIYKED